MINRPNEHLFTTRPTVILELPLHRRTRILHPEQVILKIDDETHDIGALCYAVRSDKKRKPTQPREVDIGSLLKQRQKQILQLIKAISGQITDGGKALQTISGYIYRLMWFVDWADAINLHDCLAGGEATRSAFRAWASDTYER